jgi:hypothetical protein
MTLKEKFNPYCDNLFSSKEVNAENCVDVADDYAIEFLDWYGGLRLDQVDGKKTKELLEIFKKEKGYDS